MAPNDVLAETVKKIETEARKKAEEIIASAKAEARNILTKTNAELEKTKMERIAKEKEKLEFEMKQELHSAESIARHREMQTRKQIIEAVRREVLVKLKAMEKEKKREILGKMLRIAKKQIPEGFVYANPEDAEVVRGFAVYPFKATVNCAGGIIVEEKSGERVLDLRYETLVERVFTERGEELWKILFE
ncbi:MAG: V-type ATP synthase subunit E family protein [Thermoplasmata archaeon]|nr:V-type ATP synthase subunit E family protein [Thermoplasmata archaeon]